MPPDSICLLENSKESNLETNSATSSRNNKKRDLSGLQRQRLLGSGKTAEVYLCSESASP